MNQKLEKNDQIVHPSEIPLSNPIHNLHTDPFETTPEPIWQAVDPSVIPLFDDINNLYIGSIENAPGSIMTAEGEFPATISGEVLLYGRIIVNAFVVERLRRVALYGALESPEADPRIDVFSLAGPLEGTTLESALTGTVTSMVEQLHYGALSSELDPFIKSDDAVFPQVEQIAAKLGWDPQGELDEKAVQITISFVSDEVVDKKLGIVQRITLNPITINFFLAGTGAPSPEPHYSLQSNCLSPEVGSPAVLPCPALQQTFTRSLSLKFINFTRTPTIPEDPGYDRAEIETFCNTQIHGLCEVWRNKAALEFVVQDTLIEARPEDKITFHSLTPLQETTTSESGMSSIEKQGYASTTQIEIYLIEQFVGDGHGGGISYNSGQASAYCILALDQSDQVAGNPYLLAHEVGHVLGLAHPLGTPNLETTGLIDSSPQSIMQPSNPPGSPNPSDNSLFNCLIFLPPSPVLPPKTLNGKVLDPQPPLNPSVSSPGAADCFHPDSVPPSA
jgi:hypothetical protein